MNETLSQLVDSLFEQAKRGEDLSSGISRVRAAIKKVIEGQDAIFGKLHALVESFREVIPEENQRYQAAIKALSATLKLSRQEIASAVNRHVEELKILEKVLIYTLPRPAELKMREARSQDLRNEILRLREEITQLEKEEKEIANSIAGQGKETAIVEKALREVFTDIRAEIISVKKKIEELGMETAQQPIQDAEVKTDFAGKKQSSGQKSIITGQLSSLNDANPQKTCPMCGGQMSFSTIRKRWQCLCTYEELEKDEVQSKYREPGGDTIFPEPTLDSEQKKKCRMCGGRMDYYLSEKKWQCFSCGHEESEKDEVQSTKDGVRRTNDEVRITNKELSADSIFPDPTPVSEPKQNGEKGEQKKTPELTPASETKQTCSMCGGRMDYNAAESKWQCHSCGFEYFKKGEGQGKSEEKPDHSNALRAIPSAEPLFDLSSTAKPSPGYWGLKKGSSSPKKMPAVRKSCPACGKTMQSNGSGKGWQCRYCGYERRI